MSFWEGVGFVAIGWLLCAVVEKVWRGAAWLAKDIVKTFRDS